MLTLYSVPTKDSSAEETAAVSLLTALEFHIVRSYLERFGDLAILADIVGIATSSLNSSVLASTADTINYHAKAFRAIGAFDPLFARVTARYVALRTIRFPDRELLLSLANLARTAQTDGQLPQLLSYDLSQLTQRNSLVACSPASDNMGEVMQTGSSSDDEIERILSSGTSMDQQMMGRVLRKIVSNLEEQSGKGSVHVSSHHGWFHRLRCFDEPTFDMVVNEWLASSLVTQRTDSLRAALPTLAGSGCVALTSFMDTLRACVARFKTSPSEGSFQTALRGVHIILPSDALAQTCSPQDAYRYRLEQRKLCLETEGHFMQCMGELIALGSMISSPKIQTQLASLLHSRPVLSILNTHIATDPGCLSKLIKDAPNDCLNQSLDALLDPTDHLRLSQKTPEQQVVAVFALASELSLPICQAAIERIFSSRTAASEGSSETLSATLLNAIKKAVEEEQPSGLELLASLDASLTGQIRQNAEREIINASAFLVTSTIKAEELEIVSPKTIQKFLAVIDLTPDKSVETTEQPLMLQALIERLKGMAQALDDNRLSVLDVYAWLTALFRLAVSHASTMLSNATQPYQTAMMSAMAALLTHPSLELYPTITEHVFDVTVFLSDYISDDVRFHVTRLDGARLASDSRCVFILGVTAPVDGWLVLARPVNAPPNQSSSQPPTPTPLQGQPSPYQNPQVSTAGSATPQQRYSSQQQQRQQQMQVSPQAQQMRNMQQYTQHPQNKMLPAQLQRTPSGQPAPTPLSQMQQMQQMQQRAMQPSPVYSQRATPAASQSQAAAQAPGKLQLKQEREIRHYPFVQPRWEILAESSGNPTGNETAINLSLFGARRV